MFLKRIKTIIKYFTMKKTYSICSFLLLLFVFSCSKKAPFYDELGQGSYLNLVKTNNTNLNSTDANSTVGMVVKEYGEPVESVNLYVSTTATLDKTKWKLIKNFPYASGSELTLAATTTQIATALGITQASMNPGTTYYMYNEVVTKDGRKFSSANTSFVDLESQPGFNVALSWRATVVCPFINKVPFEKIRNFNIENHHGCIAVKSKIHYQDLQDVISLIVENGETPMLLLLDGITDIRNIGAIARSAYCCGVHAIVIPEKGVGALNEDAIATSAGALETLPVCRVKSLTNAIDEMHLNGIKVFASDMKADVNIFNIDFMQCR